MNNMVALVPLRGESKSIPKKNIKVMAGKPLCAWVLEAACNAQVFDKIYVSTDCKEVAEVVEALGLNIGIIMRPARLATDVATTESVMLHFAEEVKFDTMATIQATSPLVRAEDFINAIQMFKTDKLDSLLTGVEMKRFFWTEQGVPLNYNPLKRPMRQQIRGTIMENGAFYLTTRKILEKEQSRLGGRIGIYKMAENTAVEVDEPEDWAVVEALLLERFQEGLGAKLKKIKLLGMDCDGVLTDAGMYYNENGEELKKFNTRDGQGLALLRVKGIKTAIITSENSQVVKHRAAKLKVDELYMGVEDKKVVIEALMAKYQLKAENIAYVSDDLNDLPAIELAGLSFAVNDAVEAVRNRADYKLSAAGGRGAIREVCDLIIDSNVFDVYNGVPDCNR